MGEYFILVASQVGTLFLLMAVGYVLARLGRFGYETQSQATTLLLYVVTPCIIVDTLQLSPSPQLMRSMAQCLALTLALYLGFALLMELFFRRQPADTGAVLRFGAAYGNVGFMGLPLIQGVLGEAGMIFAVVGQVVFNLLAWSHGVLAMGDRRRFSLGKMILNPGILGSAAGIALFLLDLRLPAVAGSAVSFLGSMNTPLAMVIIGAQMASADLLATFRCPRLYLSAGLKLLLFPLLTAAALLLLRPDHTMYIAMVILAGTPAAGTTSMFAQQFDRDTATAAQLITLTNLCCLVTLPCCAALAALALP